MKNIKSIVQVIFDPLIKKYNLRLAILNSEEFFLIGLGYALWIFIDPTDVRSDFWYVSVDDNGKIAVYTLMYLQKERFDSQNADIFGNPTTFEEHIKANLRVDAAWLMNKFQDILSGDKTWLKDYPDAGSFSSHVATFLAPYFRGQGYPVIIKED